MHRSFQRKHPEKATGGIFFREFGNNAIQPRQTEVMSCMDGVKRTLIVFRVSHRASTTENQAYAMERHIKNLGYKPTVISLTASNWKKPIKEMTEILRQVRNKQWDEIHLWRVDRTGRSHKYDCDLWHACEESGTIIHFLEEDLRSDRQEDRIKFYRLSVDAEEERLRISKRTKLGIARSRAAAAASGLPDPVQGKKKGVRWGKVKEKIRSILNDLRAGTSIRRIARAFEIHQRTVASIKNTPIAVLRRQTGDNTLQDWRE